MSEKKLSKEENDTKLKAFIKAGGRKGAEADFDAILKQSVKPKEYKKSSGKIK